MRATDVERRPPSGFGHQQERVEVGNHGNFVPSHLVRAMPCMLGLCGGQTLINLQWGTLAAAGAFSQLQGIGSEIAVDPRELAGQMGLLTGTETLQFRLCFQLDGPPQKRGPPSGIGHWPDQTGRRRGIDPGESQLAGQRIVHAPTRQGHRDAVQAPMLIDRLDFAAHEGGEGEMVCADEGSLNAPAGGVWHLCAPEFFRDRRIRGPAGLNIRLEHHPFKMGGRRRERLRVSSSRIAILLLRRGR